MADWVAIARLISELRRVHDFRLVSAESIVDITDRSPALLDRIDMLTREALLTGSETSLDMRCKASCLLELIDEADDDTATLLARSLARDVLALVHPEDWAITPAAVHAQSPGEQAVSDSQPNKLALISRG